MLAASVAEFANRTMALAALLRDLERTLRDIARIVLVVVLLLDLIRLDLRLMRR